MPGLAVCAPALEPPPVLKCEQEQLERHFEARARAAGVVVLRGLRVTGVRQGPDGVQVTARGRQGQVTCTARYAVGADGARSTVRGQAAFACRTYPATVSALAGDVRLAEPGALRAGWHAPPPAGSSSRTSRTSPEVRLRTLDCTGAHRGRHLPPTPEELRAEVARITGRDVPMGQARWLSRFSDFSRITLSYRAGRILLAGDAAHVHFPVGGQGLSAGVLDALNLGWKLALAVRGAAAPACWTPTTSSAARPRSVIDNTRAQLALMRPDTGLDPLRTLFRELLAGGGGGGENGVLASMVSAQDTVLPPRAADPSPGRGASWPTPNSPPPRAAPTSSACWPPAARCCCCATAPTAPAGRPRPGRGPGCCGWCAPGRSPPCPAARSFSARTATSAGRPAPAPSPPPWAPTSARAPAGSTDRANPTPPPAPVPAQVRGRRRTPAARTPAQARVRA